MLKSLGSPYGVGRVTGIWWKWKIDPYSVDAVLIYAQLGHGRRSGLFTDYTFGVWNEGELVPFAKAYSGLTDLEIREVDRFVRQNTVDRFGPVRHVKPTLVFEVAFENILLSNRHKAGIAVRFPRILAGAPTRWPPRPTHWTASERCCGLRPSDSRSSPLPPLWIGCGAIWFAGITNSTSWSRPSSTSVI